MLIVLGVLVPPVVFAIIAATTPLLLYLVVDCQVPLIYKGFGQLKLFQWFSLEVTCYIFVEFCVYACLYVHICVFAGLAKIIFATYSNLEQYLYPQSDSSAAVNDPEYRHGPVAAVARRRYPTTDRNYIQWQPKDRIYYSRNEEDDRTEEESEKVVGTKIISASVGERKEERVKLKEPVIYTLEHKSVNVSPCISGLDKLCRSSVLLTLICSLQTLSILSLR